MKIILAQLLRAAADRLAGPIVPTPNPNLGGLFDTQTFPGHVIYTGPTFGPRSQCPRCGQWFAGTHVCHTVDLSPWSGGPTWGTYTAAGTN